MAIDFGAVEAGRHLNYYEYDPVLEYEVERTYGDDAFWGIDRLRTFGAIVGDTIADNSDVVDENGPELHTYDKHGDLKNEVEYHPAHEENARLAYENGIVADSFVAPPGRDERMPFLHNLAMEYLLSYCDIGLVCPVAMTAGVAHVLEKFGDERLEPYLEGLTAREYDDVITGAMFLTEEQGGSDVGATETVAEELDDDVYQLTGEKWFCSNIDAQGTLALGRRPGAPDGTAGLSLFLVPHELPDGELNSQIYRRLKDKLGTISVPTGEVELEGAIGYLVGEPERGFKYMTEMLNLERLSNAFGACGAMGRAVLESRIHAANRDAFGRAIEDHPLMRRDLVEMTVDHEAATAFTFEAGRVFSDREATGSEEAYRLMRMLIPIAKHRTGRMAVDTASYAMEVQGGNGYVNDFVTNRLYRDVQVLPIWEGTSNILSLDVLRAMEREAAHEPLLDAIWNYLDDVVHPILDGSKRAVRDAADDLRDSFRQIATADPADAQLAAKELADAIFDVYTGALLLAEAESQLGAGDARKALVAEQFVERYVRPDDGSLGEPDRVPIEHFDAIVRFASLAPDALLETPIADD